MRRFLFLLLAILCCSVSTFAQKTKKVKAEYTYVVPTTVAIDEAKRIALERAQIQAIAEEFGTVVSQTNSTRLVNDSGGSSVDFVSVGGSEVKGEWIETLKEPEYDIAYDGGMLVVTVKVEGKIREYSTERLSIKALALRNGAEERYAATEFADGDDLYMLFQAPVKGNLLVYLLDESEGVAYQILPYSSSEDPSYAVATTNPQILFSPRHAPAGMADIVDELTLTAEADKTYSDLYVLFSPAPLTRALSTLAQGAAPRQLPIADFRKWLSKARSADTKLNLDVIPLVIRRK